MKIIQHIYVLLLLQLQVLQSSHGTYPQPSKEFFPLLREKKSPQIIQIWKDYLNHLAFAMKNLNLVIDAPIILSGYLAPYFTEEDIKYLAEHLHTAAPFILDKTQILVGTNGQYTPAIGAALHYVEKFIQSV